MPCFPNRPRYFGAGYDQSPFATAMILRSYEEEDWRREPSIWARYDVLTEIAFKSKKDIRSKKCT